MFSQIFHVDSHKHRTSGTGDNFIADINVDQAAGADPGKLKVVILSATIPRSYYLIVAGRNTFTIRENNVNNVLITVPPGNYNVNDFKAVVLPLMNAGTMTGYQYTIDYLPRQAAYVLSCSTPGSVAALLLPDQKGSGIHEQWGFDAGSTTPLPCTSKNTVDFESHTALHLRSDIVKNDGNVLQEIYGTQAAIFSSVVYQCPQIDERAQPMARTTGRFRFWLTDTDGDYIDLRGHAISFALMVRGPLKQDKKESAAAEPAPKPVSATEEVSPKPAPIVPLSDYFHVDESDYDNLSPATDQKD